MALGGGGDSVDDKTMKERRYKTIRALSEDKVTVRSRVCRSDVKDKKRREEEGRTGREREGRATRLSGTKGSS